MSHLLENRPEDMASVVRYVGNSFLQVSIELQMRHRFSTSQVETPRVFAAIWAEVDSSGELDVLTYFGEELDRPSAAEGDGLLHTFDPGFSYEGLAIEAQKLAKDWASEATLIRMLSNAHARLTAEINQLHGAAA